MKLFTGWSWLSVLLPGCFEGDAHTQAVKPLCAGFCIQLLKGFYWSRRARRQQRCLFSLHPIPLTFLSVFSFTLYSRGPGRSWLLLHAINMFITHTLVQVGIDLLIVFWQSSKYARHRNTLKTLLSQILWRNKPFYCRNQFIWIHDTVLYFIPVGSCCVSPIRCFQLLKSKSIWCFFFIVFLGRDVTFFPTLPGF